MLSGLFLNLVNGHGATVYFRHIRTIGVVDDLTDVELDDLGGSMRPWLVIIWLCLECLSCAIDNEAFKLDFINYDELAMRFRVFSQEFDHGIFRQTVQLRLVFRETGFWHIRQADVIDRYANFFARNVILQCTPPWIFCGLSFFYVFAGLTGTARSVFAFNQ